MCSQLILENAKISQPKTFTPFKVDIVINWLTTYLPKFLLGYIINRCFWAKPKQGTAGIATEKRLFGWETLIKIFKRQGHCKWRFLLEDSFVACLDVNNLIWADYILNNLHHCWRGPFFFAKMIYLTVDVVEAY